MEPMGPIDYWTVKNKGAVEVVRRKSRFIGRAQHIQSQCAFEQLLDAQRNAYPNAGHHVFAYRLGVEVPNERCSDDGEPSGTAGQPLLHLLKENELVNVAIIVSRIFGGTLLGTGGLARAYTQAGRRALEEAVPERRILHQKFVLQIPYSVWGPLEYGFHQRRLFVEDIEYRDHISITLWVPMTNVTAFEKWIAESTSGQIAPDRKEQAYLSRTN